MTRDVSCTHVDPLYGHLLVKCDVILESIPDTIVVPLLAVFEKDSSKIVYISKGEKYKRQTVNLACNSDNFAVI